MQNWGEVIAVQKKRKKKKGINTRSTKSNKSNKVYGSYLFGSSCATGNT